MNSIGEAEKLARGAKTDERFWAKVDKRQDNECWPWQGAKTAAGYGLFWPERRTTVTAHRYMYELYYDEEVPVGIDVHHICYNKTCVNPHHLQVMSKLENTRDAYKNKTHCAKGHEWIPENFYYKSNGTKDCLKCRRDRSRNRRR